MGIQLTPRLIIAAELRAAYPNKRRADLGKIVGIKENSFTARLIRYRKATGQWRPRCRFGFHIRRPAQLSLFDPD